MAAHEEKASWRTMPRKDQLAILFLLRFVEPSVKYSVTTYLYYQLKSLDPSLSSGEVIRQSATMQTAYIIGQCLSSLVLGKIADSPRGGRKFVLLLGTAASSGQLADLPSRFPGRFGNVWLLKNYPYAPPALANGAILLFAFLAVFFFLEETSPQLKDRNDFGLGISRKLKTWISRLRHGPSYSRLQDEGSHTSTEMEAVGLMAPGTPESDLARRSESEYDEERDGAEQEEKNVAIAQQKTKTPAVLPLRRIMTKNLCLMLLTAAIQEGHTAAYTSLWPSFLSDPVVANPYTDALPFRFSGGAGLAPSDIAITLSVVGAMALPVQFLIYPRISQRLGTMRTWRLFMRGFPLVYILVPYVAVMARALGNHSPATWTFIILVQVLLMVCASFLTPSQLILIR
ncbi:major facilitator superfamily transporter [Diaporthe amygdali]|uniref:major facilitator superfamily transporter n=1 Tax=Phomopsis amygdali TaxID=1214568 RepID=UPI0022FE2A0B|nr:major facilitator superfamily transporter [Diaporthe amygdali]KAJ0108373.1 major facilitator superfamily transporter [Diaporthe amygdali]